MSSPRVSVITISYRDLPGLRGTVASVRAQRTSAEIEHIVIDGGSGPAVADYLAGLDPQPAYWRSAPDRGRYDAMNQGIARATGDLIWLLHSGDRFADPDVVEAVRRRLDRPRTRWGYGRCRLVDADGQPIGTLGAVPFDRARFLAGRAVIPHQATFVGADIADRLGPYDEQFGLAADQLYLFGAALLQPPVVLDRILCDFDTTGAGSTRAIKYNFADLRRAWDVIGYYPHGSRAVARVESRCAEYYHRTRTAIQVRG
ncbi:glycosyltransferase family 2 protein [Skermania piniformis]|uniref:4,4'-diaponeurosporenoate glycosyltransferase n=1 Tax=Skermania pinensis TaxID=39122 RepID=A0ABX8SF41_9ACTN|nr:glycosyltransferase family 2 protein [Skermania piniformis]QXQ15215.1 glycosyltransferase [Skermania piniformis]